MADLTRAQLTDYLRSIAELESSVYRLEEAKKRIEREIQWRPKPRAKESMEEYRPGTVPQKRKPRPAPTYHPPRDGFDIAEGLKGGGFLAVGILLLCTRFTFLKYVGILLVIVGLFFPWMEICRCRDEKEKAEELFDEATCRHAEYMASIEPEYAKAQQEYDQQMQLYREKVAAEERRYQADMAEDAWNVALAQAEARRLDAPLAETKDILSRYYALDVIYPKYRNLVAMTSMYEYLASGRCTELTGPDGAYNLYEMELRQDLIIDRLDSIVARLDNIRKNQYTLYRELQRTNELLGGISSDIQGILRSTNDIAESSRDMAASGRRMAANQAEIAKNSQRIAQSSYVTALCAQAQTENTEALRRLALIPN